MKRFKSIIKNSNKFNVNIKLAQGLVLSINNTSRREGKTGKSTNIYGKFWYATPKGTVLFKLIGKEAEYDTSNMQKINEIICYRLAKQMGLKCAEYVPATLEDKQGLASVSFLKDGQKLLSISDVIICKKSLKSIMENLKLVEGEYNSIDYKNIFYSIYSYSIFDLLTLQEDRHFDNLSFIIDKQNNLTIAPLYDNEYSFLNDVFTFTNKTEYFSVKEFIDVFFINVGIISPQEKKYHSGLEAFDEIAKQIIQMAKKDKKCDDILKNILNNANLTSIFNDLKNEGYKTGVDYQVFITDLLNYTKKRVTHLYKILSKEKEIIK